MGRLKRAGRTLRATAWASRAKHSGWLANASSWASHRQPASLSTEQRALNLDQKEGGAWQGSGTRPEVISKLREAEVFIAQGRSVAEAACAIGVTEQSYCRRSKEYGGLKMDQPRRLKDLERESARLRRAVADLTLSKLILPEAAREPSAWGRIILPIGHRYL